LRDCFEITLPCEVDTIVILTNGYCSHSTSMILYPILYQTERNCIINLFLLLLFGTIRSHLQLYRRIVHHRLHLYSSRSRYLASS